MWRDLFIQMPHSKSYSVKRLLGASKLDFQMVLVAANPTHIGNVRILNKYNRFTVGNAKRGKCLQLANHLNGDILHLCNEVYIRGRCKHVVSKCLLGLLD